MRAPLYWRWASVLALALALALAAFALRCQHAARPSSALEPANAARSERPPARPVVAAPASSKVDAGGASTSAARATDNAPAVAPNSVARMLAITDDADRALLSEIERRTRAAPPAAVHDLLALRRAGAPRAELERLIATRLGEPIALRLAAMHWLNTVAPQPGAPSDAVQPVPPAFGQGGGARRMQAVEPR